MDAIRKGLRGKKYLGNTLAWLPYDLEELRDHLDPNGTVDWPNFSVKYDIDHRIPSSWFIWENFDDTEFLTCFSLDNLWLMSKSENRGKRDRFHSASSKQLGNKAYLDVISRNTK